MSNPKDGVKANLTSKDSPDSPDEVSGSEEGLPDSVFSTPRESQKTPRRDDAISRNVEPFVPVVPIRKRGRGAISPHGSQERATSPKKAKDDHPSMFETDANPDVADDSNGEGICQPSPSQKQTKSTHDKTSSSEQAIDQPTEPNNKEITSIWSLPSQEPGHSRTAQSENPSDQPGKQTDASAANNNSRPQPHPNQGHHGPTSRSTNVPLINKNVPPTYHKFPIILEDLTTGPATIAGLGPTAVLKLWANSPVGQIISQRQLAGNRWLIGCTSADQQNKLVHLTKLAQIPIKCTIPTATTEGVIKNIPLAQDLRELRPLIPQAKSIFRLNNRDGTASKAIKITFESHTLPKFVTIGLQDYQVFTYVAPVHRCQKCNRFGHLKKECKTKKQICARCSQPGHNTPDCKAVTSRCVNCKGPHSAAYLGCPEYKLRHTANKIRAENFIPYATAINRAKQALAEQNQNQPSPPSPPPELDPVWRREGLNPAFKTYASVAGGTNNSNQPRPNRQTDNRREQTVETPHVPPTNNQNPIEQQKTNTTVKNPKKKRMPTITVRPRLLSAEAKAIRLRAQRTRQALTKRLTEKKINDMIVTQIEKTMQPVLNTISQQITSLQKTITEISPPSTSTPTPPTEITPSQPFSELNNLAKQTTGKSRGEAFLTQILCEMAKARTACKPAILVTGINSLLPPPLKVPSITINNNSHIFKLAELACGTPGDQSRTKIRASSQSNKPQHKQHNNEGGC